MATGKIVRFDDTRGYGFITPDEGGDDVFLHANDLDMEREFVRAGAKVTFEIEDGPRGQFATSVQRAGGDGAPGGSRAGGGPSGDDFYDFFSVDEFRHTVTEILLEVSPSINGEQIRQIRAAFETLARKHGWAE